MKRKKAFTLIELLVVIAIIALLLAILMPSLQTVKELATGVVCLSNQKSLCTAWMLYSTENNDKLVGGSTYYGGNRATPYRWVEGPMLEPIYDSTRASIAQLSLETRINGIRAGKLYTYLENEKVYHCPGDKNFVKNDEPFAVYRSYAITGLMNGEHFRNRVGNIYSRIKDLYKYDGKDLKVAIKTSDIRVPSSKYVFVEEDVVGGKKEGSQQEYNRGGWVLLGGETLNWWDGPAGYHNGGSTFGYADGHAEKPKWRDKDTVAKVEEGIDDPDPKNNEDLKWLVPSYIPMP